MLPGLETLSRAAASAPANFIVTGVPIPDGFRQSV